MSLDQAGKVRVGEELNWDRLEEYLRSKLDFINGNFDYAQFHGGHANLTYLLTFGKTELILRRPPFGKIAPGAHDMHREYRVLEALQPYYDRAPKAYHYCDNDTIIGSHFVVTQRRKGIVVRSELPSIFSSIEKVEEKLTLALVKAIGDLHKVPINGKKVQVLGKPDGYLFRQVSGWTKRWKLSKTEENPQMDELLMFLTYSIPPSRVTSVVHNDLKLDNCQFDPNDPTRVQSIFDWDMTTIGDPLSDLGMTLAFYPDERLKILQKLPNIVKGNYPHKDFIKEHYQEYTGFDLSNIAWYEILSLAKCAIIAQQLYKRFIEGSTVDRRMAGFGQIGKALINLAHGMSSKS